MNHAARETSRNSTYPKRSRRAPVAADRRLHGLLMLLGAAAVAQTVVAAEPHSLQLRPAVVRDPAMNNQPALRLLLPAGWKTDGSVLWRAEMSNVATTNLRVWNPNNRDALDILPVEPLVWSKDDAAGTKPGAIYKGNRVVPVIGDAVAFIEEMAPRLRPRLQTARVIEQTNLPRAAKTIDSAPKQPGTTAWVRAAKVRYEYRESGKIIQEDVYCALIFETFSSRPGTVYWRPEHFFTFRAEKGRLDTAAPTLHTILSSLRYDSAWFNRYFRVVLARRQGVRAPAGTAELSTLFSTLSAESTPAARQAFEHVLAENDRAHKAFGLSVRGLEHYRVPGDNELVSLPGGFRMAWSSANGDYMLSNDSAFTPSGGSSPLWRRLERSSE